MIRFYLVFCLFALYKFAAQAQPTPDWSTLPKTLWKFSPPSKAGFTASPTIDNDLVFIGCLDSTLYALDMANGGTKWSMRVGGPIRSTVKVQKDNLYLYSGEGALICINKKTGKENWKFQTQTGFMGDRSYDLADPYQSSPTLHGEMIYFGSSDGRLYAIDQKSGKQIWSFQTNDIVHTTPFIYNNKVYIGSYDGHVYCLDKDAGYVIWKFKAIGNRFFPKGEMMGNPVVSKGLVYIGSRDYNLYALDAENGYCHWIKPFAGGWALNITPHDSVIYVGTSDDRAVYAYRSKGGAQLWKEDVKFNILGDMAFNGKVILTGTLMGKLFCIEAKTGKAKWVFTTEGYVKNRLKYFKEDDTFRDDVFKRVRTPADALTAYYNLGGIYSTPAVGGGRIVLSTYEGLVYCLGY